MSLRMAAFCSLWIDFLEAFLGEGLEIEDYYSQLKSIEGPYAEERIKWIQIKYFRPAQIPCEDLRHLLPGIQPVQAADSVHRQLDILIPGPFIERIYFFFR